MSVVRSLELAFAPFIFCAKRLFSNTFVCSTGRERSRKKWSYEEVDLDFASSDEDEVVQDSDDTLSDSDVDVERFDPAPPYRHPRVKDVRAAENARMRAQLQVGAPSVCSGRKHKVKQESSACILVLKLNTLSTMSLESSERLLFQFRCEILRGRSALIESFCDRKFDPT